VETLILIRIHSDRARRR